MPVPVFCFDVDGTLLDRQGAIHANDVAILRGQFGARLVPATGRPLGSLKRAFSRHGLFQGAQLPFPLILQNGAVIYTEMCQDPAYFPFDRQLQAELVDLLLALPRVTFFLLGMDEVQVLWPSPFGLQEAQRFDFTIRPFRQKDRWKPYCKVMCLSTDSKDLEEIGQVVRSWPLECALSMETVLEITPQGVNKGSGLRVLLEALQLPDAVVYAAGDGWNDLPLFENSHFTFAPHSSPAEIRARAGKVIDLRPAGLLEPMLREAGVW